MHEAELQKQTLRVVIGRLRRWGTRQRESICSRDSQRSTQLQHPQKCLRKERHPLPPLNVFIWAIVPVNRLMAKDREATTINAEVPFHQV